MKKKTLTLLIVLIAALCAYAQNEQNMPIIPAPQSVTYNAGTYTLNTNVVMYAKNVKNLTPYIQAEFQQKLGLKINTVKKKDQAQLILELNKDAHSDAEGYKLSVTKNGIHITASTEPGLFYGIQSLMQLLLASSNHKTLSNLEITDAPRFSWRSYMLDEARHFHGTKSVKQMLDVMAQLKMNVFHWHLVDDQGWRIEIKKYPLLTQVGSKRTDTQVGGFGSEKRAGCAHEGYYTQEEVKEIIAYAKARHIKIVPEIEMPGHASASIAAYPWLGTKNEKIDVPIVFGKHYHTYNVIDPKVQDFLEDVISEVLALFKTDVIHIGGDEVRFNHWEEDEKMVAYKKQKNFSSFMDIQIEFTNIMSQFIQKKGASMMGWNEILGKNLHASDNIKFSETSTKIAPNVVVQFWAGDLKELVKAAQDGYRLVNSHSGSTYLDYDYASIPLKKAYHFDPIPKNLPQQYHQNIIGSGCQMWTEFVPTKEILNKMTFPRIAAYAEVGWTQPAQKDFDNFVTRLRPVVGRWEAMGINGYPCPELQ